MVAQELKCDLFDTNKVKDDMLVDYDIIIFGGGLYASGINGIALIKSSFSSLRDKDVIVFTVGLADPEKSDFTSLIDKNFTSEMKERVKVFHLRGGMDYHKLSFVHRTMMAMLKSMISRKPEKDLSEDDKGILQTVRTVGGLHKEGKHIVHRGLRNDSTERIANPFCAIIQMK